MKASEEVTDYGSNENLICERDILKFIEIEKPTTSCFVNELSNNLSYFAWMVREWNRRPRPLARDSSLVLVDR